MARIEKINQAVKEEISNILQKDVKDPRLEFVTITEVVVSRDLQHAKVFFSVLNSVKNIHEVQEGLNSARGYVRKLIGKRVRMRYTPEVDFVYDSSVEYGMRIEETIERIKNELRESP